jgi:HAD superfamily hydrolase (TIGR01458 family)
VPIDGAIDAVNELRRQGSALRFFTNTDSRPATELGDELVRHGFNVSPDEIFTPATAAKNLLERAPGARILPLLSPGLTPMFQPHIASNDDTVTHVVIGAVSRILTWELMDKAFRALQSGAELIALQRGRYSKHHDGNHIDTGAFVTALEYAAGVNARVMGKPSSEFLKLTAASTGAMPAEVWVVGDDATTDIAMGNAVGAVTVQVQTGKYRDQPAERAIHSATHTIASIADLPRLIAATPTK